MTSASAQTLFPCQISYDEPEYKAALESKTGVEIFSFLCESGMNPRPLWDSYKIKAPSQLWAIVSPAIRIVEPLKSLKLEDLEAVKHKNQIIESYSFLKGQSWLRLRDGYSARSRARTLRCVGRHDHGTLRLY